MEWVLAAVATVCWVTFYATFQVWSRQNLRDFRAFVLKESYIRFLVHCGMEEHVENQSILTPVARMNEVYRAASSMIGMATMTAWAPFVALWREGGIVLGIAEVTFGVLAVGMTIRAWSRTTALRRDVAEIEDKIKRFETQEPLRPLTPATGAEPA